VAGVRLLDGIRREEANRVDGEVVQICRGHRVAFPEQGSQPRNIAQIENRGKCAKRGLFCYNAASPLTHRSD
jgi:hypothetical protein